MSRWPSAANANLDLFLERAAAYSVRGLRRFAQDVSASWAKTVSTPEGRVDAEGEAIDIVSIHSAKGLEWPIVIMINTASSPPQRERIVHRAEDDTLHWTIGGVASPGLSAVLQSEAEDLARERARLLYVGCTRAKDLLILPRADQASRSAYSRAVDLSFDTLPELDLAGIIGSAPKPDRGPDNLQDAATFTGEAQRIASLATPISWLRPSQHDDDLAEFDDVSEDDYEAETPREVIGAGRIRGLLLHKLIEEIVWEGLEESAAALAARARLLLVDLASIAGTRVGLPDCEEVASTALATLALPEIASLRPHLVPEVPFYAMAVSDQGGSPMAGRVDALVVEDGIVTAVIDWKSDVAPGDQQRREHVEQLRLYMMATGAPRGALVYMSLGWIRWVELPAGWRPT